MKIFSAVLIVMLCLEAGAQKASDTLIKGYTFLRFNAINLVDLSEPNISFGIESRLFNRVSFAIDGGYIVHSQRFRFMGKSSGFIVRPAIRYYPDNSKIFFETEFHYKESTHRIQDWIGRDEVEGVPAYEEYKAFRLRKRVTGQHFKVGGLVNVSPKLWFELYIGIGFRVRKYTVMDDLGFVYSFNQNFNNVTTGEKERLMAVPAGFRVLYRIR